MKIPNFFGLGRQIGAESLGVFSAKLQHPSWHCKSLVYGFEHLFFFSTKNFGFKA